MRGLWVATYCLFVTHLTEGQLYPVILDSHVKSVQLPALHEEDIIEAFVFAEQEANKRRKINLDFINAGQALSKSDLSASARLLGTASRTSMRLHWIQEHLEDATRFLAIKLNLTKSEIATGLSSIVLPDNLQVVQRCRKLRNAGVCNVKAKYRTADGSCNNLNHTSWGRANSCFKRWIHPRYSDGISSPRESGGNSTLPSARLVSTTLVTDVNLTSKEYTHMSMAWGQFVAHDMAKTVSPTGGYKEKAYSCCTSNSSLEQPSSCFPIQIPENDYFYSKKNQTCMNFIRSNACSRNCKLGEARSQVNERTSFIDGSVLYGDNERDGIKLRLFEGGRLQSQITNFGELLPVSLDPENDQCSKAIRNFSCFRSGDNRVNYQPGLVAMHTIWHREHNRIAGILAKDYPALKDEDIFQETRRIIGAEMQMITYSELLPPLIGQDYAKHFQISVLDEGYSEYEANLDPTASTEFFTGAFRFGHTLIQNLFEQIKSNGEANTDLNLQYHMMNPIPFYEGKLDATLRGLYYQGAQEFDQHFVTSMTNHLMEVPGSDFGLDIVAINVQRGREQGLPPYIRMVEYCFNIKIKSFEDLHILMGKACWRQLQKLYGYVENIDFYSGAFLETHIKDAMVGPTVACLTGKQFHDLKFGDRFYFEHGKQKGSFSEGQLQEIRKSTLSRVICENSDDIDMISPNVLRSMSTTNRLTHCKDIPKPEFENWLEK